jgi:hydrogenase nickel incorporation protein HypA/HybF
MHELSIALGIIDVAAEELDRQGGGTVVAVHLKIGAYSGVVKQALHSAFELARENSVLAQSQLLIVEVPVTVLCPRCACEQAVESLPELRCCQCGEFGSEIVKGRELEIVALEIES